MSARRTSRSSSRSSTTEGALAVASAARALRKKTPAVVYDLDKVDRVIRAIRDDLSPIPKCQLMFAVKANHCAPLLAHFAKRGLGADVASYAELRMALRARFRTISVTTPMLEAKLVRAAARAGIIVDLNGPSQLEQWLRWRPQSQRAIGVRVRIARAIEDEGSPETVRGVVGRESLSRFGFDADDPSLRRPALRKRGLLIKQLHFHAGELGPLERAFATITTCLEIAERFPDVETINLGGGFSRLYENREEARELFTRVGAHLDKMRSRPSSRSPTIIFEPGMALIAASGYLVTRVVAADQHPSGRRTVVVDSSAWNLSAWVPPRMFGVVRDEQQHHRGKRSAVVHEIVGATCYERDIFLRDASLPALRVGDCLILSGFGAYATSMARRTHALPHPAEWTLSQHTLRTTL